MSERVVKRCKFCDQDHEITMTVLLGMLVETCDVLPSGAVYVTSSSLIRPQT